MHGLITSQEVLERWIRELGFLPFFSNRIEGFSIEEHTPEELWFNDEHPGPWEWKGPVIGNWESAYGKFFEKKAGFVSLEWFPDFMNWRRSKFPLKKLGEEPRHILEVLRGCESALSKELKAKSGYSMARKRTKFNPDNPLEPIVNKHNGADFDKLINELQMGTWVCIADFEYLFSKKGERYGWGVARYCTPEAMYEIDVHQCVEGRTPQQSLERIVRHLFSVLPEATEDQVRKLLE